MLSHRYVFAGLVLNAGYTLWTLENTGAHQFIMMRTVHKCWVYKEEKKPQCVCRGDRGMEGGRNPYRVARMYFVAMLV